MSAVAPAPVRSAEQPMAFTFEEFLRGAGIAVALYVVLSFPALGLLVDLPLQSASPQTAESADALGHIGDTLGRILRSLTIGGLYAGLFGLIFTLPAALLTALLGSPGAHLLGRALRTQPRYGVHAALFACYGLAVGAVASPLTLTVLGMGMREESVLDFAARIAPFAIASCLAVTGGWHLTARLALRKDARAALAELSPATRGGDPSAT